MKDYKLSTNEPQKEIQADELEAYIDANKGLSYPALRIIVFLLQLGVAGTCIFFAVSTQSWAAIGLTTLAILSALCGLAFLQPREFWRRNIKGFAIKIKQHKQLTTRKRDEAIYPEYEFQYQISPYRKQVPLDSYGSNRHDIEHGTLWNCMASYIPLQGSWGYCGMTSGAPSLRWLNVKNLRLQGCIMVADVKDANGIRINEIALHDLPGYLRAAKVGGEMRIRDLLTHHPIPKEELPPEARAN